MFGGYEILDFSLLKPIFVSDTSEILFLNTVQRWIYRVCLSNTTTSYEGILGFSPNIRQVYGVRVVSGCKLIVYLSAVGESCDSSTWILQRHNGMRVWVWNKLTNTILFPRSNVLQSLWKNTYYRIVSDDRIGYMATYVVWSLDMRTKNGN